MKTKFKETQIGIIPEDWEMKQIGLLFDISAGGDLSKISFSKNKSKEFPFPIYSNSLNDKGLYGFSKEYQYEPECITITGRGKVGRSEYRKEPFNAIVRLLVLKPKQEISCYFIASFINSRLDFSHVGSAVNQLTAPMISKRMVALPPIQEQFAIAKILSDLNSKIELQQQMNKNLNEMIMNIFKHWFIDYNYPTNKHPAQNFSDKQIVSDKDSSQLPKGWKIETLNDTCSLITDGSHVSPKEDKSGTQCIATVKNMREYDFDLDFCKKISQQDYDELVRSGCKPEKNDVLLSKDGTMGLTLLHNGAKIVLLSSIAILRTNEKISNYYLKAYLSQKNIQKLLKEGHSSGSALPRIVLKDLKKLPILVPDFEMIQKFDQVVKPLFEGIFTNMYSMNSLVKIHNLLLPKIMSGKIRIPIEVI